MCFVVMRKVSLYWNDKMHSKRGMYNKRPPKRAVEFKWWVMIFSF